MSSMTNPGRFYADQEHEIMRMFEEEDTDWDYISRSFLAPANLEAMRAMSAGKHAPEHLARARETMQSMEQTLEVDGKGAEEIARLMAPMVRLVQSVQVLTENPDWYKDFDEGTASRQSRGDDAPGSNGRDVEEKSSAELMPTEAIAAEPVPADTAQAEPASGPGLIERRRSGEVSPDPAPAAEPTQS
nr:hypothetical protein B0A51_17034 [Rachicladosporium sp. CCFEE 5018]